MMVGAQPPRSLRLMIVVAAILAVVFVARQCMRSASVTRGNALAAFANRFAALVVELPRPGGVVLSVTVDFKGIPYKPAPQPFAGPVSIESDKPLYITLDPNPQRSNAGTRKFQNILLSALAAILFGPFLLAGAGLLAVAFRFGVQ